VILFSIMISKCSNSLFDPKDLGKDGITAEFQDKKLKTV